MKNIEVNEKLVSSCGFYCGACKSYLKQKCQGCDSNNNYWARNCKVKSCCKENNYRTCVDCSRYNDVKDCKKLNSLFIRFFAFFVGYDRLAGIQKIKKTGLLGFATKMAEDNSMWVQRK